MNVGVLARGKINGILRTGALINGVFCYRTTIGAVRRVPQDEVDGLEATKSRVDPCPVCGEPMFSSDRCSLVTATNTAIHVGCVSTSGAVCVFTGPKE